MLGGGSILVCCLSAALSVVTGWGRTCPEKAPAAPCPGEQYPDTAIGCFCTPEHGCAPWVGGRSGRVAVDLSPRRGCRCVPSPPEVLPSGLFGCCRRWEKHSFPPKGGVPSCLAGPCLQGMALAWDRAGVLRPPARAGREPGNPRGCPPCQAGTPAVHFGSRDAVTLTTEDLRDPVCVSSMFWGVMGLSA